MSFEQRDIERNQREEEKKNRKNQEKYDFFMQKKILSESSSLINKLAKEIAGEFGITISEAKNLISWEAWSSLDSLKQSIGKVPQTLDIQWLSDAIRKAKSSIETLSKKHRESLRHTLDEDALTPEKHEYKLSKKILPSSFRNRAINPQSISDQLAWIWVWIIDSWEAIVIFSYELWKWIILSPYHLYLLLSWKWNISKNLKI